MYCESAVYASLCAQAGPEGLFALNRYEPQTSNVETMEPLAGVILRFENLYQELTLMTFERIPHRNLPVVTFQASPEAGLSRPRLIPRRAHPSRGGPICPEAGCTSHLQGYLAHKQPPPPTGPPQGPRLRPTVGSYDGVFSYERGTPAVPPLPSSRSSLLSRP